MAALVASPVSARLCRDTKGLFTPCPEALTKAAQHHLQQRVALANPEPAHGEAAVATALVRPPPAPTKPPRAKPRLCHDSKGLYTPCV